MISQNAKRCGGIVKNLSHQRVSTEQAITQGVVVLQPMFSVSTLRIKGRREFFSCSGGGKPRFETDRVRCENTYAAACQCWSKRLKTISCDLAHLALSHGPLTGMLM